MASTYEPIATTTVAIAATSITFSSIPSTYTDLRLVIVFKAVLAGSNPGYQFNSDTGSSYSYTAINGSGTAAASQSSNTNNQCYLISNSTASTAQSQIFTTDIFSYTGSNYKTLLTTFSGDLNGSGNVSGVVNLWRSTAAINSVKFLFDSGTMAIGTSATLYGIKAA